jgi:hypothetical protein
LRARSGETAGDEKFVEAEFFGGGGHGRGRRI